MALSEGEIGPIWATLALSESGIGPMWIKFPPSEAGNVPIWATLALSKGGIGPIWVKLALSEGGYGTGRWIWGQSWPKPCVLPCKLDVQVGTVTIFGVESVTFCPIWGHLDSANLHGKTRCVC